MICAIHQPQFLPWPGYIAKIMLCDLFVFLDDVQFKKNEFQNRNRIMLADRIAWITVPVSFKFGDTISEVRVVDSSVWKGKMIKTFKQYYGKAPYFNIYFPALEDILNKKWDNLAELNIATVKWIMDSMEVTKQTVRSSDLKGVTGIKTDRLIDICKILEADTYLSGEGAKSYIEIEKFRQNGIKLIFLKFLPELYYNYYNRDKKRGENLSIVDTLFYCGGKNCRELLKRSVIIKEKLE